MFIFTSVTLKLKYVVIFYKLWMKNICKSSYFLYLNGWSFHTFRLPACCSRCVAQAFIITQEFLPWLKVSNLGFQVMNHLSARNLIADNKWFAVNQSFCSCNYEFGLSVFLRCDSKVLDIRYIVNPKQIKSCRGRVKSIHSREAEPELCIILFPSVSLKKI